MKLRAKLLCYTAAIAISAGASYAAIDGQALADQYLAEGYTFVEVKVGPTQTKVQAIKDGIKTEVIYDNESLEIIETETEAADEEDLAQTGSEVTTVDEDFEDSDDDEDDEEDDDDEDDDDDDDDDDSDESDESGESDDSGTDGDGDGDGDSSGSDGDGDSDGEGDGEGGGDDD